MSATWLDAFKRECGIKRALIVHGNVMDVFEDSSTGHVGSIVDVLTTALRESGYDSVIHWDREAGYTSRDAQAIDKLKHDTVSSTGGKTCDGDDYDVALEDYTEEQDSGQGSSQPASVDDYLAIILNAMLSPDGGEKRAFILDWSDLLFGQASALSEAERQWLLMLSKALRNSSECMDTATAMAGPAGSIIVMVCGSLGGIPPQFYQGNPLVRDIAVPLPGRPQRKAYVERILERFQLQPRMIPGEAVFDSFVDSLDGMTLRDLTQLARLSRQVPGEALTSEKLLNLYKYGEKSSPWEELSRNKLKTIDEALSKRVKGQNEAVEKLKSIIVRAYTGLSGLQHSNRQRTPKGALFFVGPTGVGKTELAKTLAWFLFNDEESFLRFDMSEYNHENSDQRLVGAPPGYVGFEEGGQLTNAVRNRPFSVVLFDEIEKAHGRILDKFLQILEDGRLTDGKGDTVYFSETVIIFTSNIGAAEVKPESGSPEEIREQFIKAVRDHFIYELKRPELLNRIGNNIVPFNFIQDDDVYRQIVRAKLAPLKEFLIEKYKFRDLVFHNEESALELLIGKLDKSNGGRGILNELQTRLIDPLSNFLFVEDDPGNYKGKTLTVLQAGGQFTFAVD